MPRYQYPLNLRFKLLALAPRIIVTDANGEEILYVHQKTFKLKEDVRIYRDQSKDEEVYRIQAEQILDFNTRYNFFESRSDKHLGSVKARGWRSIWRATYLLDDAAGNQTHYIQEDNPWIKIGDALLGEVPIVNLFTGFMLHPAYTAYRGTDKNDQSHPVMTLKKEAAFFEGRYSIDIHTPDMSSDEELRAVLSFVLLVQFMRRRG
jgi:hypothetical protein